MPKSGGTADGRTGRSSRVDEGRFCRFWRPSDDVHAEPAQPCRGQAPRRPCGHDPPSGESRRRSRDPDRRVPSPRRRQHACLPPRVGRRRRAARPIQLLRGWAAAAPRRPRRSRPRPGSARRRRRVRARPSLHDVSRTGSARRAARLRPSTDRGARRRDAAVHGRGGGRARLRRGLGVRADRPTPVGRPGGRAARELHRDRPRPGLRPPEPRAQRDRIAPHRRAASRGALSHRRACHLRGPRADVTSVRRRDRGPCRPGRAIVRRVDGGGFAGPDE